jgi:hypothetical protein
MFVSLEIACFEKFGVSMSDGCNFYFRHVVISCCCVGGREESVTLHICYGDVIPEIAVNVHVVCSHSVSSNDLRLNKRR